MAVGATALVLAAAYALLFLLERLAPLRRPNAPLASRLRVNVAMTALALGTAALLVRPAAAGALMLSEGSAFGLVRLAGLTGVAEIAASFLLMDLTFYYWHVANHRSRFLWRMHKVHHIDPDLDVTTGFRFHFGEVALSAGFRAVQLMAIGPSLAAFLAYELAFQVHTLFHHSNLRLPLALERRFARLIITPRMHGIHHSQFREETESNFGVVFSGWDALHGTLRLGVPQDRITIGVPAYSAIEDNRVGRCLAIPFSAQADDWQGRQHRPGSPAGPRAPMAP